MVIVMIEPEKTVARAGRFKPGISGNKMGRPRGSKNRTTMAAQAIIDGDGEALSRKLVELALAGDGNALRIVFDRLLPPRRESTISIRLPPINNAGDIPGALSALLAAASDGTLLPSEAQRLSTIINQYANAIELADIHTRLQKLEGLKP